MVVLEIGNSRMKSPPQYLNSVTGACAHSVGESP